MAHSGSIFKSVCQDILEPRGVKVGGYKDEIFDTFAESKRDELSCQICYMIVKDPHTCVNKHLFCGGCIYAWSMTREDNTDRCPMCRVKGSYSSDDVLSSTMNSMAVKCMTCQWKGQLSDYRSHSHGREDVGVDPKNAGLPCIWSAGGDIVFPDLTSPADIEETVEASRRRHQRRYLDTQLELIEGQARLAFLLDVFEEDLQRHRDNLGTLVRLQSSYNAQQFNEVMRLEAELGQITANLLGLIENASNDVNSMTERLRNSGGGSSQPRGAPPAIQSTISRLSSYTARLRADRGGNSLSSGPVEEPQEPIRRARYFRMRERSSIPAQATADPLRAEESNRDGESNPIPRGDQFLSSGGHNSSTTSLEPTRNAPTPLNRASLRSSNPFSTTDPPQSSTSTTREATSHLPSINSEPASSSGQTRAPSGRGRYTTPQPPARTRAEPAVSNPYTITWPPASGSNTSQVNNSISINRTVTRQELRRLADERSRRSSNNGTS